MPLSKRSMEDCFCEDDYLCNNCEDEWIKKSSNQLASNGKICTVAELKELYEANPFGTRYQLVALIASKIWTTSVKSSVWIEDPSRKKDEKRNTTTIACCFKGFLPTLEMNCQFVFQNVLIRYNADACNDSNARYQIELDRCSQVYQVHEEIPIVYNPIKLGDVPSEILKTSDGKRFLDIAAVPICDLGGDHPRRIIMQDDSEFKNEITLTLWGDDAIDEKRIKKIMGKPILIRNGLCHYFGGFGGE